MAHPGGLGQGVCGSGNRPGTFDLVARASSTPVLPWASGEDLPFSSLRVNHSPVAAIFATQIFINPVKHLFFGVKVALKGFVKVALENVGHGSLLWYAFSMAHPGGLGQGVRGSGYRPGTHDLVARAGSTRVLSTRFLPQPHSTVQ